MSEQPLDEASITSENMTLRNATHRTERATANQIVGNNLMSRVALGIANSDDFIHHQLSMLEAEDKQNHPLLSHFRRKSLLALNQVNPQPCGQYIGLPLFDSYSPGFQEYFGFQNNLPRGAYLDYLRKGFVYEASGVPHCEYQKFMSFQCEQQFLRSASAVAWCQSIQRKLSFDGSNGGNASSYSIEKSSVSYSQSKCDKMPKASFVTHCQADRPPPFTGAKNNRFAPEASIFYEENYPIGGTQEPTATVKNLETPTSPKTFKKPKADSRWLTSFCELKQFKQENRHTIVPRGYSENPKLASWVAEQRKQYRLLCDNKQSSMTQQRIDKLNELGFIWHAQEDAWMRQFSELKRFHEEHGHCNVPIRDEKYPKLGLWVKEQRRHYALRKRGRPSHLSKERCCMLNSIDFCYDAHNTTWLKYFHKLEKCYKDHGSCMIPASYADPKLVTWINYQRRQYRKRERGEPNHINAKRIDALNSIGFVWSPRQNAYDDCDRFSSPYTNTTDC